MSMQLIGKLGTLLRGGARETLEGVVDANALRILEQEVIDFEQALLGSKRQLTQLVAERMQLEREQNRLEQRQAAREVQLAAALAAGRDSEVEPLADRIADYETEVANQRTAAAALLAEEQRRTEALRASALELESYLRELRLFKARQRDARLRGRSGRGQTELQSARAALHSSLGRLRERRDDNHSLEEAAAELERQLREDPLAQVDRACAERQRTERRTAIIARARHQSSVRPL